MSATRGLTEAGQSIWLDNITRDLLTTGTLARYVDELSVAGITSNPTIFEKAITRGDAYDAEIRSLSAEGKAGDELLFELILHDLTAAADILAPVHRRTAGRGRLGVGGGGARAGRTTPQGRWRRPSGCSRRRPGPTCS